MNNIKKIAPWNKGKKGLQTAWNKGIPMREDSKLKLSQKNLKDNPGYQAIHAWVRKWGGTADYCEMADDTCKGKYEWSNISHQYKRDLNDYQQLCSSHHVKFDKEYRRKEKRKDTAHLRVAKVYADLSYATKRKVGSVLVKDGRIIGCGYNGTIAGTDNKCEYWQDGVLKTFPYVIHSELNAIIFSLKNGISLEGSHIYITHSPCYECAKVILQTGIISVTYGEKTKHDDALEYLQNNKIKVKQLDNII
jgi:dCMP deaminase